MEGDPAMKRFRLSPPRISGSARSALLLWGRRLALPLAVAVAGVIVGSVGARAVEIALRQRLLDGIHTWALRESSVGTLPSGDPLAEGLKAFVEANPFGVERQIALQERTPAAAEPDRASFRKARLVGTLPPEGAFVLVGETVRLILCGQTAQGYELTDVEPGQALFRGEEGDLLVLTLEFARAVAAAPPARAARPAPAPEPAALSVTAAAPGKEGAVDRDLVNNLLMNPFEELRKIRLQPHVQDGSAAGIEVRYIRDDSILRQLGVSRGDVIQSVNGVQIQNMNDVANAISSLMGGSRFDVSVLRGGQPVELSYTVK